MTPVVDERAFSVPAFLGNDPRVAVVGLGRTGVSAVGFLHRLGVECVAMDSRPRPPGLEAVRQYEGIAVFAGALRGDVLARATHILVSPGLPLDEPVIRSALERGVALISDIDLFAALARAPVIAVTGSNGKSTVTSLVAEMARLAGMRVRAGGNLGTPALDLLCPECDLYVLELSSFQLERSRKLRLDAGAVLNVSPDHLDRHPSVAAYAAIKGKLFAWSHCQVANRDDPLVAGLAENASAAADSEPGAGRGRNPGQSHKSISPSPSGRGARGEGDKSHLPEGEGLQHRAKSTPNGKNGGRAIVLGRNPDCCQTQTLWFSLEDPGADYGLLDVRGEPWLARRGEPLLEAAGVALSGRHNLANALAALALAEAGGIPLEPALEALRRFGGLPHRMQRAGEIDGVVWINDSKGTNVGATEAAISGLEGPVVLLAGGVGKGADFSSLRPAVEAKVRMAILFGSDRRLLAEALAPATRVVEVEDLETAMVVARRNAKPGETVLLSPACASLDQFEDYQARGNLFESVVRRWQSMD